MDQTHLMEHVSLRVGRSVDSLELAEDVRVLRRDAAGLQDGHTEGEDASNFQLTCQTVTSSQLSLCDVAQFEVCRKQRGCGWGWGGVC